MHWLFLFAQNWRFLSATEWRFLPGVNIVQIRDVRIGYNFIP